MITFSTNFFKAMDSEYNNAIHEITNRDIEAQYILLARRGNSDAIRLITGLCYPTIIKWITKTPRYRRYSGIGDELVAEVVLAIPGAINDFDLTVGKRFITFFNARIMNALNKAVFADNLVHIPENRLRKGTSLEMASIDSEAMARVNLESVMDADTYLDRRRANDTIGDTEKRIDTDTIRRNIREQGAFVLGKEEMSVLETLLDDTWSPDVFARHSGRSAEYTRKIRKSVLHKLGGRAVLSEIFEEI